MNVPIDVRRHPRVAGTGPGSLPVPPDLLQARAARLRDAAASSGLAALAIFSQPSRLLSGTATHGNLRYLLDWTAGSSPAMLVLPIEGEPVLAVPGPSDVGDVRESCPWIADVRCEPSRHHGRLARVALAERGIEGRIGLIGAQELTHQVYAELTAADPRWAFAPADEILDVQRAVKDEVGLARLRRAAAICDTMFEALADALRRPGLPVWQAQALLNSVGLLEGAEYAWSWMVAGPRPDRTRRRPEENLRPIQVGDCVVMGLYLIYAGYYGHALRMMSVGEPAEAHRRVWRAVFEAQEAAAEQLRPGVSARAPGQAADATLFRHFPEAREGDRVRFRSTHFIGLDYSEYPTSKTIAQPSASSYLGGLAANLVDIPMQAGMTIELHPNVCPPGLGLGALGDVFVVTPEGGERLTTFPRELYVVTPL